MFYRALNFMIFCWLYISSYSHFIFHYIDGFSWNFYFFWQSFPYKNSTCSPCFWQKNGNIEIWEKMVSQGKTWRNHQYWRNMTVSPSLETRTALPGPGGSWTRRNCWKPRQRCREMRCWRWCWWMRCEKRKATWARTGSRDLGSLELDLGKSEKFIEIWLWRENWKSKY